MGSASDLTNHNWFRLLIWLSICLNGFDLDLRVLDSTVARPQTWMRIFDSYG